MLWNLPLAGWLSVAFEERRGLDQQPQRVVEPRGVHFDDGAVEQGARPLLAPLGGEPADDFLKCDARLVEGPFAPVADRQVNVGLGELFRLAQRLENGRALAD